MARFAGFVCDVCENVWENSTRTTEHTKYTGFVKRNGPKRELCPRCVEKVAPVGDGEAGAEIQTTVVPTSTPHTLPTPQTPQV